MAASVDLVATWAAASAGIEGTANVLGGAGGGVCDRVGGSKARN
jgi:hypothetical protein